MIGHAACSDRGDLVVIVGTFGENTPEDERGKILGLMEPSTVVVSSLDYFDLSAVRASISTNTEITVGRLALSRSPRGVLPSREPLWVTSPSRQFQYLFAQGIVPLLPQEEEAILHLPRHRVPLLSPFRAR